MLLEFGSPWEGGGRAGKKSGVLFRPGFLCRGMEKPREKLTPVGHEDTTCLDFKCVPFHATLRTSWLPCVQSLDLIWRIFPRQKCHWILSCVGVVGSTAPFRNYVDTLNCGLASQCQKNGILGPGKLGRNFLMSL